MNTTVGTVSSDPAEKVTVVPCMNLWFDDGNVVLIAGNTSFRVYRGFLARHSPIFKDILNLPKAIDTPDTQIEGCPCVKLSDSAEDIRCMLSILCDYGDRCMNPNVALPFATVASMLTIGMKYQIDRIAQEAIRRLKVCFPTQLSEFHHNNIFSDDRTKIENPSIFIPILMVKKDAIDVVRLGRMFDLTTIVPAAYYSCSAKLSTDDLFGAVASQQWSIDMLQTCFRGIDHLRQRQLSHLNILFQRNTAFSCPCPTECRKNMGNSILRDLQEGLHLANPDPLQLSSVWFDNWVGSRGVCNECIKNCTSALKNDQKETWKRLGGYFNIN
ncbi:hypothetical protein C8Q75DRAFT_763410 [Abortiporus biennis]|nr:hypothetical protein C8Q75DRAFT_763410 [Abortiporus biennis]